MAHSDCTSTPVPCLGALDAVVAADPAPSALRGSLCVGVHLLDHIQWWSIDFDGDDGRRFVDESCGASYRAEVPSRHSAAVLVSGTEALRLTGETEVPFEGPQPLALGDRALLDRFIRRYLMDDDAISVRLALRPKRGRR
ncbi:MAG: hypothetical protein RMA76_02225 [Deltaproteobacteria bacterium]|jgi:hypothetical protein